MTRRSLAAFVVAAALLPLSPGANAADPPKPEWPRETCSKKQFTDPKGDDTPHPSVGGGKHPGLDIIGGYLRTTEDAVQVYVELDDIPDTMPTADPGYRYTVAFKYNTQQFTFQYILPNPLTAAALFPSNAPTAAPGKNDHTGVIDTKADFMWISQPRATFETNAKKPIEPGTQFESVRFTAEWLANGGLTMQKVDGIEPAADAAKWTVFDDYCFGPAPAVLSNLAVAKPTVQYGDPVTVSAKLVADAGTALAGKPVHFTIAGDAGGPKTATTNADGVATATYVPKLTASATPRAVTATFAGDTTDGKATIEGGTVTITQEKTAFAPLKVVKSGTARTVTATLLDDDKKPVAGVKVDWLVNGKKVASLVTNAKGQTVYKKAKPGQFVQVRLLAVSGKYLASTSAKVKLA